MKCTLNEYSLLISVWLGGRYDLDLNSMRF